MQLVLMAIVVIIFFLGTDRLYKRYWNRSLIVSVDFLSEVVEEGSEVYIAEKVENAKLLPMPTFTIKFQIDRSITFSDKESTSRTDKQYRNDCLVVMPFESITRKFIAKCEKRGYYSIESLDLVAQDLRYGTILSEERSNLDTAQQSIYVLPAKSNYKRQRELFNKISGEHITKTLVQEDPFEFRGIRDYTQTDPMSRINWKASARTGDWKVNQFYDTISQKINIFLNVHQQTVIREDELIEESIRLVRSLIEYFQRKSIDVRVYTNGTDIVNGSEISLEHGSGEKYVQNCLKQLARINTAEISRNMEDMFNGLSAERNRHRVDNELNLLISVEETEELAEAFQRYNIDKCYGKWLIPVHEAVKRYKEENNLLIAKKSKNIDVEYLILELEEH